MELINAANNSAGASQKQYEKTLESMETKLQRLKNAWDEFVMGLANQEILKGAVDLLSGLLSTINQIISALSGGNGTVKTFLTLLTSISALKLGSASFGKALRSKLVGEFVKSITGKAPEFEKVGQTSASEFTKSFFKTLSDDFKKKKGLKEIGVDLFGSIKSRKEMDKAFTTDIHTLENGADDKTKTQLEEIKTIYKQEGFEAAEKKAKEYGIDLANTKKANKDFGESVTGVGQNIKGLSSALTAAGGALTVFGGLLKTSGSDEAKKAGDAIQKIGVALMGIGQVIPMIQNLIVALGGSATASLLPIMAIIGAVGILVAAISTVVKAAKERTLEFQMEKAAEATENAKTAAEEVKAAYDNLFSARDSHNKAVEALENLTKGTIEWKKQLLEANNIILDLLTTYPELAQYLTRDENGLLNFSDVGYDTLIKNQLEEYRQRQNEYGITQIYEAGLNTEKVKQQEQDGINSLTKKAIDLRNQSPFLGGQAIYNEYNASGSGYGGVKDIFFNTLGKYLSDITHDLYYEAGNEKGQTAKKDLLSIGYTEEEINDYIKTMEEVGPVVLEAQQAQQNYLNTLDIGAKETDSYAKEVQQGYGAMLMDSMQSEIDSKKNEYKTLSDSQLEDKYKELYGVDEVPEEFKNLDNSVKALQLAQKEATTIIVNKMSDMLIALNGIKDKSQAELIAGFLNNGSNFNQDTANAILGWNSGDLEKLLSDTGMTQQMLDAFGVSTIDELLPKIKEIANNVNSSYDITRNKLSGQARQALANTNDTNELNSGTYKVYADQVAKFSSYGIQNMTTQMMNELTQGKSKDQIEKIYASMEGFDLTDAKQFRQWVELLADQGISFPIHQTEQWTQKIKDATNALNSFSTDNFKEEIKSTMDLIDDVKDNSTGMFTDEQYQSLIEQGANENDFMWNGQNWVYLGGTMEDLATALQNNLSALNENTQALLKRQIDQAQGLVSKGISGDTIDEYREEYEKSSKSALYRLMDDYGIESVIDSQTGSALGKSGVPNITEEEATRLLAQIQNNLNNYLANQDKYQALAQYGNIVSKTADEVRLSGGSNDKQRTAVLTQASKDGLDTTELIKYSKTLQNLTEEIPTVKKLESGMADEIARDNMMLSKGFKDVVNNFEDWQQALQNGKETEEYNQAINGLKIDIGNMLGTSVDNFDDSFFINNLDLIKQAIDGDLSAIDELRKEAAKEIVLGFDVNGNEGLEAAREEILNFIQEFDGQSIEIGARLDDSDFIGALNHMLESGKVTAQEITSTLESIGYEPVISYKTVQVPSMKAGKSSDPLMALLTGPDQTTYYKTVNIPYISGMAGTYKGSATKTLSNYTPSGGSGSSGSGGSSSEQEDWVNPYDWLYNLTEKINEQLRIREKLERKYDTILQNRSKNAQDVYDNMMNQISALEREQSLQEEMLSKRKYEANKYMSDNASLNKYGKLVTDESGQIRVQIDWDLIDTVTDTEEGQKIEDYISKLEFIRDEIRNAEDGIDDVQDRLLEIYDLGKEEYFDFEDKVLQAIINARQKEIDKLTAIDESINDTNQKIIDSMQSQIDKFRQDRDNKKAEQDLADKQQQLVYMQQDTSGANQMDILQLQDEINNAQQDYTDELIDQKISELQEQNNKASEERQMQIKIMEQQLEHDQEIGALWQQAYNLMEEGLDKNGLVRSSKLLEILQDSESWQGMSELGKVKWLNELETQLKAAVNYLRVGRSTAGLLAKGELKSGQNLTFTTKDGKKVTGKIGANGQITDSYDNVYKNVYQTEDGSFTTDENYQVAPSKPSSGNSGSSNSGSSSDNKGSTQTLGPAKKIKKGGQINAKGAKIYATSDGGPGLEQYYGNDPIYTVLDVGNQYVKVRHHSLSSGVSGFFKKTDVKAYKTGGLANYTGLAWLDGTPSRPEAILNAKDTQNFIQLKDILSSLFNRDKGSSESGGDNYLDIDINVEKIDSDYDVTRIAEQVKKMAYDDAKYRNVNVINNKR